MKRNFLGVDLSDMEKANYLSRVLGIFYEGLVDNWWETRGFESIGKPSVYDKNDRYLHKTFDYTVVKDKKIYIVEAKCYIAYENFENFEVTTDLLDSYAHSRKSDSFKFFLELGSTKEPFQKYRFYCDQFDKRPFIPSGKILLWTTINKSEMNKIKDRYHISFLFSVRKILREMNLEANSGSAAGKRHREYVNARKCWATELFDSLLE